MLAIIWFSLFILFYNKAALQTISLIIREHLYILLSRILKKEVLEW